MRAVWQNKWAGVAVSFLVSLLTFVDLILDFHSQVIYFFALGAGLAGLVLFHLKGNLFCRKNTVVSLAGALFLMFAAASVIPRSFLSDLDLIWQCLFLAAVFAIAFLMFKGLCPVFQDSLTARRETKWTPSQVFWITAALAAFSLSLFWTACFPGIGGYDWNDQIAQINGDSPYLNIHTIGHTIFLKLLLSIWNNMAIVILVHILMIAFLQALFAKYLYGRGIAFRWILGLTVLSTSRFSLAHYFFPL